MISLTPTRQPGRAAARLIKKKSSGERGSGVLGREGGRRCERAGAVPGGGGHRLPPSTAVIQLCGGGGDAGQRGREGGAARCPHGAADPRGDRGCACRGTLRGGARDGGCAADCRAGSVPRPRPHPRRCPQPLKADHPPAVGPPGAGQRVGMFWTRLCAEPPPLGPAPPSPHAALCVCSGVSSARRCVHTSGTEPGAHRAVTASGCVCGVTAPVCAALRACTHTHTDTQTHTHTHTHTHVNVCAPALGADI